MQEWSTSKESNLTTELLLAQFQKVNHYFNYKIRIIHFSFNVKLKFSQNSNDKVSIVRSLEEPVHRIPTYGPICEDVMSGPRKYNRVNNNWGDESWRFSSAIKSLHFRSSWQDMKVKNTRVRVFGTSFADICGDTKYFWMDHSWCKIFQSSNVFGIRRVLNLILR